VSTPLIIDPEFRALIPPLTVEERQQLEENLKMDGCRDPLVVWQGVLLDGHHRYEICTVHGIRYTVVEQTCADRDEAKVWIIRNQFGRRNLPLYVRAELALELEPLVARVAERRRLSNLKIGALLPDAVNSNLPGERTAKTLGRVSGASAETVYRVKRLQQVAPAEMKAQLRRGEITINHAFTTLRAEGKVPYTPRRVGPAMRTTHQPVAPRKENNTDSLADRLEVITKELHRRRVANDDDMRNSRWNPVATSILKQREMLDWIQTTLETLVDELHAREHISARPRVPLKPRHRASTGA
jgi:hypothetical protein